MKKQKMITVLGTRPEIIRLALIIPKLDEYFDHVFVHTGQNFDQSLSGQFFDQLGLRAPDHYLDVRADSAMEQVAQIISKCDAMFEQERPDRMLILGDTNSALCAIPAKRRGIEVFHMEAGNRCYDDCVPEELNRRIIDHSSDLLMPYTQGSRRNLLAEGFAAQRVFVTGNPIKEVIDHYQAQTESSTILERIGLSSDSYFLTTLHRQENVDTDARLRTFILALNTAARDYDLPVIMSTHPRTRARIEATGLDDGGIRFLEPFGFFDFLHLEKNARCVLSDSGTVQEECCIFGVPTVTLRDVTERPETIDCGSNILSGCDENRLLMCLEVAMKFLGGWSVPPEYLTTNVSDTVCKILASHHEGK